MRLFRLLDIPFLCAKLIELYKRLRVGVVSYLNTKPFLYGIKRSGLMERVELIEAYPSKIAAMLQNNELDLGLLPVAVIPQIPNAKMITNYCIGAIREVASVAIFSEVPMDQIQTVILDYQSRTSVNLAKILLRDFWKQSVEFLPATENFQNQIQGTTAAVVIGDRALEQRMISAHCYDLATAWIEHTGLPFVFAAWVANKDLGEDFEDAFNMASAFGLKHIDEVVAENPYPVYDLKEYYTKNISYELDPAKRKGMALFLSLMEQSG
jgi:chorismate dehydratase